MRNKQAGRSHMGGGTNLLFLLFERRLKQPKEDHDIVLIIYDCELNTSAVQISINW